MHCEVQGEALTGETVGSAIEPRNQESGTPMLLSDTRCAGCADGRAEGAEGELDSRSVAAADGTPQGAVISTLLANIYLHYVQDLWARQWCQRHARGEMIVVRYADDSVVGFRTQWQTQRFLAQLQERMALFGLSVNASKTLLIVFGRCAVRSRGRQGLVKPETFDFQGLTHC